MRFLADGPDIPDDLLVARDAGDVIFFCGAGVSQHKARLPNFEKLGRRVIETLGATNESPARALLDKALEVGRMAGVGGLVSTDRVFGLLEREFEVGDVRAAVAEAIRPPDGYGLDAHRILLDLARSPTGVTRIVTTNFDLLFEECDATLPSFGPPNLPDPRTARDFRGVFHLHGRVDASYRAPRDDEFVVSSRDFGRAYLLDGWATRFIQSLLARFQIVFIGYTADDPPVQYLLEALNLQAGNRARLYALQDGESGEAAALWEHRGVRAIPFDASKGFQPLWDTLAAWAGRARDIDRWYDELLAVASNGPAELSPHIRGQIAHVYSTREGAKRVAAANTLPDGSWLLTLDPQQRYRRPVPVDRSDVSKELFDPFEALGLDSDIVPQPPQPDQNLIDRRIPPAAWDVLKPTRADIEGMSETGGGVLRGHVVPHAAALPPRLMSTAIWIKRVAHQPITLWWASQQSGLHQRLRREIEFDLRVNGDRFPAAIHRGWRILFAAWDDAGPAHDSAFEINARADREGWTESLVRAAVGLCRPRLKAGHNWRVSHPLNVEGPISPDDVIRFDVDYPSPPLAPSIPEDQLGYAVKQCRANLELAISLEAEISGNDRLHFETSRADDGEVLAENSHGLTGAIVRMQSLMTRLAAKDRRAARAEIGKWPTDDLYVFARLRIWAAGKKILAPREAAKIFVSLPDNVFWGSLHERDLLYALRDRWADLGKSDREALEDRLRQGSYPWEATVHGDPIVWAASDRMSRLHWLRQYGVAFSFDVSAEMRALQALAPEWTEEVGNAAADSNAPRVYHVTTDPDPEPLLDTPIAQILSQAEEAGQMRFRDHTRREPFSGLADSRPVRALAALTDAGRRGEIPVWAWSDFLRAERRERDSLRLIRVIAGRLLRLPSAALREIAYPVSEWMKQICPRLYGDAASVLPSLWDGVIEALSHDETDPPRSRDSWANAALNGPIGRLFELLIKDPAKDGLTAGNGFPTAWLARLDQLLQLPGEKHCQALVMTTFQLNWVYSIDPAWTERQLLPSAVSNAAEGDAFWEGVVWAARVPQRSLFCRISTSMIQRAQRPSARRRDGENLAGFLLAGWGGDDNAAEPERLITHAQLRETLVGGDDEFRSQILWHLQRWSGEVSTRWRDRVVLFFTCVWPKHRALRTPAISSRLTDFLLASGELLPGLMPLILPRLVPIRAGPGTALEYREHPTVNPVERFPAATLDLLWAILGEDTAYWPYRVEDILDRLAAAPETRGDPRLSELRRRRYR